MNYRHVFHAGNFADVVKHVGFTRLVAHLLRKNTPFRVIDTHAGVGLYDLAGAEAGRTGEWQGGVGRLATPFEPEVEDLLGPYRAVLAAIRARHGETAYPGSPAILREMLRPNDRAILIEKHPAHAAALTARFNAVGTLKVLAADGWASLPGLLPPRERRGLVLFDPPYELPDEWPTAIRRLGLAAHRWPTGIFALWYPIKTAGPLDPAVAGLRMPAAVSAVALEIRIPASASGRLAGSGLLVLNPPWRFADEAGVWLPALADRFSPGRGHATVSEVQAAGGASAPTGRTSRGDGH